MSVGTALQLRVVWPAKSCTLILWTKTCEDYQPTAHDQGELVVQRLIEEVQTQPTEDPNSELGPDCINILYRS